MRGKPGPNSLWYAAALDDDNKCVERSPITSVYSTARGAGHALANVYPQYRVFLFRAVKSVGRVASVKVTDL